MNDTLTSPPIPASDWRAPAQPADTNGLTVTDYARKIHWWVRLFGVVWLTSMIVGAVVAAIAVIAVGVQASNVDTSISRGGFSSRAECMAASWTTASQCKSLFGND